jgi:hypothetical protein
MRSLHVALTGPEALAEGLVAQGVDFTRIPPPAATDEGTLGALVVAYADDRIEDANRRVAAHLADARPALAAVAPAGALVHDAPGRRWVLLGGPVGGAGDLGVHGRRAAAAACVLEGWTIDLADAEAMLDAGEVAVAAAGDHGCVAVGAAAVSPSTPCWLVQDLRGGRGAVAPVLRGGDAPWAGDTSDEALERERVLSEVVAPALAGALRSGGPLEVAPLARRAARMGDDGWARGEALSLLLLRELLPAVAERSAPAAAALAGIADGDGLGLSVVAGAARAALADAPGREHCSLISAVAAEPGGGMALQLAALPGRWFGGVAGRDPDAVPAGDLPLAALLGIGPELDLDVRAWCDLDEVPPVPVRALGPAPGDPTTVRATRLPRGALTAALSALLYALEQDGPA